MADPPDAPDDSADADCEEGDAALSSSLWTGGRSRAWSTHLLDCARCRARAARAETARAATVTLDDAARALGIDPDTITPADPADLRAWQRRAAAGDPAPPTSATDGG